MLQARSFRLNTELHLAAVARGCRGSEIATTGFDRPDNGDGQRLWNLAPRIPAEQRFSRIYRGRKELIDHIFVSQALVGQIAQDHVTTPTAQDPRPQLTSTPPKGEARPGLTIDPS